MGQFQVTEYGLGGFDPSKPDGNLVRTSTVIRSDESDIIDQLDVRLDQALSNLRAYVAAPSPTAAQTTAVVKLLCRVAIVLIRQRFGRFDSVD